MAEYGSFLDAAEKAHIIFRHVLPDPLSDALVTQYVVRVRANTWSEAQGFNALEGLLTNSFPKLRYLDTPCEDTDGMRASTAYDFTDYDIHSVAMGWMTLVDAKTLLKGENAEGEERTFDRHNPKDWSREELIEFNFLATIAYLSSKNRTGDAINLMDLMIRHKALLKGEWVTRVPGFVEVAQAGRAKGYASLNGRYRYANARAGVSGTYFYILDGAMRVQFSEVTESDTMMAGESTHGSVLRYNPDCGRTIIEPYPPGHKVGDPPVWSTIPLDNVQPPQSLGQQILTVVQVAATFVVQFANALFSIATFGQSVDGVIKVITGSIMAAAEGKDATPKIVQGMQNTVAGVDAAYKTANDNANTDNAIEQIIFASDGTKYAEVLNQVAAESEELKQKADAARADVEREYSPSTLPVAPSIGWADRLFAKR